MAKRLCTTQINPEIVAPIYPGMSLNRTRQVPWGETHWYKCGMQTMPVQLVSWPVCADGGMRYQHKVRSLVICERSQNQASYERSIRIRSSGNVFQHLSEHHQPWETLTWRSPGFPFFYHGICLWEGGDLENQTTTPL